MFGDARSVPSGTTVEADLCIIGGGAAGIALAREFIDTSVRVVLLESGGVEFDAKTQALYRGRLTGLSYFPLDAARLRFFGGSTNHWGGLCRPFEEEDFEPQPGVPHTGWPIGKSDIDPYYPQAQEIVGLKRPDWSLSSLMKEDQFTPLAIGDSVATRFVQVVPHERRSFATRYHSELAGAKNITVYLHANVTEIETSESGGKVTGVEVRTLSGRQFSVSSKIFTLAVGGIENPRLLLVSRRRQPNGVGNQHGLVGRFFLEHPRFLAGQLAPLDFPLKVGFYDLHTVRGRQIKGYLSLVNRLQRRDGIVDVQVELKPKFTKRFEEAVNSEDVAALRRLTRKTGQLDGDFGKHVVAVAKGLSAWKEYVLPGAPLPLPYPEVMGELIRSKPIERRSLLPFLLGDIAAFGYQQATDLGPIESVGLKTRIASSPNPDSRVTLLDSRDALGMPRVRLDWRLNSIDRRSAIRTLEQLGAAFGRSGQARLRLLIHGDDRSWPSDLTGGWHHIGTTRMSSDPKQGVVDKNCRVHGMANLFVSGTSVFPTAGSGTPTMTLVALTLRLAEHLKQVLV